MNGEVKIDLQIKYNLEKAHVVSYLITYTSKNQAHLHSTLASPNRKQD